MTFLSPFEKSTSQCFPPRDFEHNFDNVTSFAQIPPLGAESSRDLGDFDFSNEMKAMGTNLDMLKGRAQDVITAYRHSLSKGQEIFDPAV